MSTETITLTEHLLGLRPYVLIEAKPDPDDENELALDVSAGGGAAKMIGALPLMMLSSLPAETNLLTGAVAEVLANYSGHPESVVRDVLGAFADHVGFPMPSGPDAEAVAAR